MLGDVGKVPEDLPEIFKESYDVLMRHPESLNGNMKVLNCILVGLEGFLQVLKDIVQVLENFIDVLEIIAQKLENNGNILKKIAEITEYVWSLRGFLRSLKRLMRSL